MSEDETEELEYFSNLIKIDLYNFKSKLLDDNSLYNLNAFEEFKNNVTISQKLVDVLAPELSKYIKASSDNIKNMMMHNVGAQLKASPINNVLRRFIK